MSLLFASAIFALAVAGATPTHAAPIVSVAPAFQFATVGDTVTVDIVVSNVGLPDEAVGGFSFTLTFDEAILAGVSGTPGAGIGSNLDLSFGFVGNTFDAFVASLENPADLPAIQAPQFTLMTLTFAAAANGLSPLTLSNVVLSNADGTATLPLASVGNGAVCVGTTEDCAKVPEPVTWLLLGSGIAATGLLRRRSG